MGGKLLSSGGGYSSKGDITVEEGGEARFSNSSFAMHQLEVVVVTLQAGREVRTMCGTSKCHTNYVLMIIGAIASGTPLGFSSNPAMAWAVSFQSEAYTYWRTEQCVTRVASFHQDQDQCLAR